MTDKLYYEDFPEGLVIPFGTYHLSKEEVIAYAREWDPQPFHLDEEAAKNSVLGGLAASGWQGSAILIRLAVEAYANKSAAMASSGMDEVKWLKPVYAGETLTGRATVLSRRVSSKRPGDGHPQDEVRALQHGGRAQDGDHRRAVHGGAQAMIGLYLEEIEEGRVVELGQPSLHARGDHRLREAI